MARQMDKEVVYCNLAFSVHVRYLFLNTPFSIRRHKVDMLKLVPQRTFSILIIGTWQRELDVTYFHVRT